MFKSSSKYFLFLISLSSLFSQTSINDSSDDEIGNLDSHFAALLDENKNTNILPNVKSQSFSITTMDMDDKISHRHSVSYDSKGNLLFYLKEDWINNRWKEYMQAKSEYNAKGDITSYSKEFFGCCGGISKRTFTYDSSGNLLIDLIGDYKRKVYIYDDNGNKIQKTNELYNNTLQRWESIWISFYLHDDFGNMVVDSSIGWDENGKKWINKRRTNYTYDLSGNVISIIYQSWRNSEFRNTYRLLYSYYLNDNRATYIAEHWGDSSWVSQFKYSYTYNYNDQLLLETTESWRDSVLSLSSRIVNNYNEFGRTSTFKEYWNKTQNNWILMYSDTLAYDKNGNNISRIVDDEFCDHMGDHCIRLHSRQLTEYNDDNRIENIVFDDSTHGQIWKKTIGELVLSDNIDHYAITGHMLKFDYGDITDLNEKDFQTVSSFRLSQNYPNPFNPATTINYYIAKNSNVELKIYDVTGRELKTLVNQQQSAGKYSVNFSAAGLPSGVYFYRLKTSSGFIKSRKMLLLK